MSEKAASAAVTSKKPAEETSAAVTSSTATAAAVQQPANSKKKKKKRYRRVKPKIPKDVLAVIHQREGVAKLEEVQPEGRKTRRSNRLALEWARKIEQQRSLNSPVVKNKFAKHKKKRNPNTGGTSALLQLNADYEADARQKKIAEAEKKNKAGSSSRARVGLETSASVSSRADSVAGGSTASLASSNQASSSRSIEKESIPADAVASVASIRSKGSADDAARSPVATRPEPATPSQEGENHKNLAAVDDNFGTSSSSLPSSSSSSSSSGSGRVEPPAGAVVAGWLTKKPIGVGLTKLIGFSQKRWFRLDGPILTYCEDSDPNSSKAKSLRLTGQSEVTLNKKKLTFYLVANPTRSKESRLAKLTAQAETDMQLDRWYKALSQTIRALKTVDFCGWLLKQPSGNKRFGYAQTRWFALRGPTLTYSDAEYGPPKGEITLSEYSRVEATAKVGVISRKDPNGFTIFASKVLVASAPSTIVRDAWIAHIQRAIDVINDPSLADQEFVFSLFDGGDEEVDDAAGGAKVGANVSGHGSQRSTFTSGNRSPSESVESAAPTPPPRNTRRQIIRSALDINNPVVMSASRRGGFADADLSGGGGGSVRDILAAGRNMSSRRMPRWVMDEIDAEEASERDGVPTDVLLTKENMSSVDDGEDAQAVNEDGGTLDEVEEGDDDEEDDQDDEDDDDNDGDDDDEDDDNNDDENPTDLAPPSKKNGDDDDAVEEALMLQVLERNTGRMSRALASDKFVTVLDSLEAQKALKLRNRMVLEVCAELLETEETYVKDLSTVIEVFVRPLKKLATKGPRRAIISQRDVEILFKDIEVILQVNEALLETLRGGLQQFKRLQRDVPLREIGEIFASMIPYMRAYAPYCSNFPFAQQKLEYCEATVPEFTKFLAAAATNERCQNLKLRDFLIKPVQRMCKYPLFLKEMLKYADKVHPDFRYLNTASESISTLTQEIEDSMSEAIASAQMYQIFLRLCDPFRKQLITPSRRFISEQSLFLIYPRAYQAMAKTPKGRLSIAPKPTGYGHQRRSQVITSIDNDSGGPGAAALAAGRSNAGVHIGYGVEWERNSMHPRCTACGRKFSMLVRRHHCRMCGTVVCADCSKARVEMATVEGRTTQHQAKKRNSTQGLTLDAAKSGDLVTDAHVEKERVCVSCTDLLLRSEAFLSQTTKPGGASSINGYSPDQEKLQHLVDSALQANATGKGDSAVAIRLLIFSDLVIVSRPLTLDNEIDVSSTNTPLSMELPPFQLTSLVVKAVEEDGQFFVCLGLPSQGQLGPGARTRTGLSEAASKRASLFSLSFRLRCCDSQQMEYIAEAINEATQIYLDESIEE